MQGFQNFRNFDDFDRMFFIPNRQAFQQDRFHPNQYYRQPSRMQHPFFPFSDFFEDPFFTGNEDPFYQNDYPKQKVNAQQKRDFDSYEKPPKPQQKRPENQSPKSQEKQQHKQAKREEKQQEEINATKTYLPIIFIFEKQNEKQFYPLKRNISLATTIEELQEIISYLCKIDDQIIIKFYNNGNYIQIDPSLTVFDVRDKIKERLQNGKENNLMFVEIKSPRKVESAKKKEEVVINQTKKDEEVQPKEEKKVIKKKPKSISSYKPKIQKIPLEEPEQKETKKKAIQTKINKKAIQTKRKNKNDDDDYNEKISSPTDDDEKITSSSNEDVTDDDDVIVKKDTNGNDNKYFIQIFNEEKVIEIKLDDDNATVLNLKEKIGKMRNVKNLNNIKIVFAGKELLSDIVLKELNVGDTIIFVYIRSEEDILLLTAKALRIEDYDDNEEYDNSEEEEDDDNEEEDD